MQRRQTDGDPALRADAQRNRDLLLAAAREVFAEQGLDAPLTEISRRAGVGAATLFRRFPTREDIITATFGQQMAEYAAAIDEALADPDPWRGFCGYVERVCAMQAEHRGFTDVLTRTFPTAKAFEKLREHSFSGFKRLIARAQEAGKLRSDFEHQDLVVVLMANAGVVAATTGSAPKASPRLVGYLLQAFATEAAKPLPPAPSPAQTYRALKRLSPPEA